MTTAALAEAMTDETVTVVVPLHIRKRGGRKVVIAPDGDSSAPEHNHPDSTLIKAIARAYRWQRLLEEGSYATLGELAAAEKISPSYVSRLMRLTLIKPESVEEILNGLSLLAKGNLSSGAGSAGKDRSRELST